MTDSPTRDAATEAWLLTDVVNRLRRVLRSSIRSDYPWETLPMAQVEILQRLADEPGLRNNDLAQRHRLANNTVSTLVQQLVSADLVAREPSPEDRRAVVLTLTDRGARLITEWRDAHERRIEAALGRLPPEQRAAVIAALPGLAQLVTELQLSESEPG